VGSRSSYVVAVLVLIVTAALALTPFLPQTSALWHTDDPARFYSILATFIGVDFALVAFTFAVLFVRESGLFRAEVAALVERVPASLIKWIADDTFYRDFLAAVGEAQASVRITYLSSEPPDTLRIRERAKYYRDIATLMRNRPKVQFFRLVRGSPANCRWLLEMTREFTGLPNVSISVLEKEIEPDSPLGLALSVQVIDAARSWLVALEGHEREGPYRDVYVDNAAFADAMEKYHKRLWRLAAPLLINGQAQDLATRLAAELPGEGS
jgi:hypothetical protein